uniref:non-specific serine/threonine protein kinase n=2 Tax=Macrostomum lignano TaxID=282301 RepID=A0A1I8G7X3_9PLAT
SLGCLLYELACLRPAFYLESGARTVLDRVRRGSFAKLDRRSLGLSSALTSLVDELLQVSWEKRPSCRRLLTQGSLVRRHLAQFSSLAEENAEERGGVTSRASGGLRGGSASPSDSPRRGSRGSATERPLSRMSRIQTPRPRPRWSAAGSAGGGRAGIVPEETDDLEDLIDMRDNGSSSSEDSDDDDDAGGAGSRGRRHQQRGGRYNDDEAAEDNDDDDEASSSSDEEECADTEDWALVLEEARRAVEDGQSAAAAAAASAPAGCYDSVADCLFDAYGVDGSCVDKSGRHVCAEYLRSVFDKGSRKG